MTLNHTFTGAGNSATLNWSGGPGSFWAYGTFGGGTVKLQASKPGTFAAADTIDVPDMSHSANGVLNFTLPPCHLRVNASAGTSITVIVEPVHEYGT